MIFPRFDEEPLFEDTEAPKQDLTDNLSHLLDAESVFRLGVEIEGNLKWPVWVESSFAWIGNRIVWDFDFDGKPTPDKSQGICTFTRKKRLLVFVGPHVGSVRFNLPSTA